MADVDQAVLIEAFVRWGELKGRPALVCIYEQALQNSLTGVTVTSVTFEGASGSGASNEFSTAKVLAVVEQALQILDGDTSSKRAVHAEFNDGFIRT